MANPKLAELVRRLHKKTVEGSVAWEQTIDDEVFQAPFSGATLRILKRPTKRPHAAPELMDYILQIHDEEGRLIEEINDEDYKEPLPLYHLMDEIYATARRTVMGVEQTINKLLDELN